MPMCVGHIQDPVSKNLLEAILSSIKNRLRSYMCWNENEKYAVPIMTLSSPTNQVCNLKEAGKRVAIFWINASKCR